MPKPASTMQNKATEALMWNYYMAHIYEPEGESWRNYWSRFQKYFLKRGEYFCLRELKGRDLPLDQWSYMELTTEGKRARRIEVINDIKNPENSRIKVYDRKTDELMEVMLPNLKSAPDFEK